jgi:type II secretory ATPase GspE/PulE/Tfp pilus assembly ATPase PilB-like protein
VPEPEMIKRLGIKDAKDAVFYHGSGCDRCKGRGYLGRVAIIEALPVSESIRRLIIKRASSSVIKNQAMTEGMKTLRMVGVEKALEGITTLEEIWRVTAEDR